VQDGLLTDFLVAEYDSKKLLKAFKKEFACNGTLVDDEEMGQVIQLQGDQRQKVAGFL
jgi:translation initiation factor 1